MTRRLSERISLYLARVTSKASFDFFYTGAAQGVGLATSFLTALLITNDLGLDQLGAYALILSISSFVSALADVGIGQTATRYASVAHANSELTKCNEVLAWSVNARILLAFASIIAAIFLSGWLGTHVWSGGISSEFIADAFILGAFTIMQQCANAYFYTYHQFKFLSLLSCLNSSLILGGVLISAWLDIMSLELIVNMSIAAALTTLLVVILKTPWGVIYAPDGTYGFRRFEIRFNFSAGSRGPLDDKYGIKPTNFAAYLIASSLIVTVFTRLDIWMLGAMLTETEVGVYKLASYFAIPLAVVVGALNTTLWPRAAKLITKAIISTFMQKTIKISLIIIAPMIFYMLSIKWLTYIIFPTHAAAISGLAIALCFRYVLAALITPAAVVGYSFGMSRVYVFVNFLQLLAVFMINDALINTIGLFAPAIGLIFSELISIAVIFPLLRRRVKSLVLT